MRQTFPDDRQKAISSDAHPRLFGLDLLRAGAILSVVYLHGYYFFPSNLYFAFAVDGVSVFFVLSGYLIGRIVIDVFVEQASTWRHLLQFWIRRWFRTLPNYYLILCTLLILTVLTGSALPPEAPLYFIFSQNLFQLHPAFFPEAWSLSIEEWFYLAFPFLIFILARRASPEARRRLFLLVTGAMILGFTAFRIRVAATHDIGSFTQWDELLRKRIVTRGDAIAFGVLAVYIQRFAPSLWRAAPRRMLAAGLALLVADRVLFMQGGDYATYISLSAVPLATALILPQLSALEPSASAIARIVYFISRISYSMYLVHFSLVMQFILPALPSVIGPNSYISYGLYWALTIGLATLLNRTWEEPMMRLRNRFSTPRERHPVSTATARR